MRPAARFHRSAGRAATVHQPARAAKRRLTVVLHAGLRLDDRAVARLAAFGHERVRVFRKPTVAILATGDEIVEADETPAGFPDSQFERLVFGGAGGAGRRKPQTLPVARDTVEHTRATIGGAWPRTCCCFPAASRRASTTWSRTRWAASEPSSFSTAC